MPDPDGGHDQGGQRDQPGQYQAVPGQDLQAVPVELVVPRLVAPGEVGGGPVPEQPGRGKPGLREVPELRPGGEHYHHPEPFWFYLPVALLALVPWTVFVVAAVVDAIRDWRFSVQQPAGQEDFRTYLTLWLLLPIVFFSLSQSKLPGYILPAIPAGAILLANFIRRREEEAAKPSLWMVLLHALLCAAIPVAALIAPFKLLHLPLGRNVIIVAAALTIITILMLWLTLENQGYRVLRFVTLVPVVIAFALLLRGTAPIINLLQSERPVELILSQTEIGRLPDIAVYDVSPAVEYGLGFYRNHPIASYERNEIPSGDHIVVAAAGTGAELAYRLPGRRVTRFGGFQLQHLDFYLITGAPTGRQHP